MSALTTHVTNRSGNRFLRGNWAPVDAELDVTGLPVTGRLPTGLVGSFLRNGPNPMFEPIGRYHMFDGDGMIHEIAFADGAASYRNRWIRSSALDAELRNGRALYPGLDDIMNFPDRNLVGDAGPIKNPANTHIIRHAGRYFALWEGSLPTELTADLETVGVWDYDGEVDAPIPAMSAHPRLDPRTGEMFSFAYSPFPPYVRYFVIEPDGTLTHKVELELPAPVMMHDFLITEDHAVFLDSPIVFNFEAAGTGGAMTSWKPENGARLGVMPRRGEAADIRWFEIEPGHVQHFWNAWEDDGTIHLSGTRMASVDFGIDGTGGPGGTDPAFPARFAIDLDAGSASWEQFDDMGGDFCRFNDEYNGIATRYGYMAGFSRRVEYLGSFDTVVRYDAQSGNRTVWDFGEDWEVGEPVFAPDPAGTAEDDGWILCVTNDRASTRSQLNVFEAARIDDGPIAVVDLPQRLAFGFHANWFPDDGR